MEKPKVIIITGPTASGKTKLGIEVAKKINGEIISADSMQIYRGLGIGTAKVTNEETEGIIHYGIDICDINEKFSVADFQNYAYTKIEEILAKGKQPIIVGGTGLYISSLIQNMIFTEYEFNEDYRKELEKIATNKGNEYVYNMLYEIDKKSAEAIHPNNLKRVIRALEIYNLTKETKTSQNAKTNKENTRYNYKTFVIDIEREKLYDRINRRIDIMIENGLIKETRWILEQNIDKNATAMQAIGYKELFAYINGEATLEQCIEKLKQESRRYAKRQLTWFRGISDTNLLDFEKDINILVDEILGSIN